MQFFFLLLFNVFLGAVLYLVISLKLERSATEYRSRKLRKEMDEMISEFNATAERNISLLERKIRVMRLLLEKTGDLRSLDVTAVEEELEAGAQDRGAAPCRSDGAEEREEVGPASPVDRRAENIAAPSIKKGLLLLTEKIRNKLLAGRDGEQEGGAAADSHMPAAETGACMDRVAERKPLIEKDLSGIRSEGRPAGNVSENPLTEEEIFEIVSSSPDRYSMVAVLKDRGCAVEEISRYSGIPIGEVRLVLNLNSSR